MGGVGLGERRSDGKMSNNPVWGGREMGGGSSHHQSSSGLIFPEGLMRWMPANWKIFGTAITGSPGKTQDQDSSPLLFKL